ncbi:MAG: hypothetical protein PVG65_06450 [Candidatus Thorarchaeota archaeon]
MDQQSMSPQSEKEENFEINTQEAPVQVPYSGDAIMVKTGNREFSLVPVACYSASVLVVGEKLYDDEDGDLVPLDLCVVWGVLADPYVLQYTDFMQEERSCTCIYDEGSPADDPEVLNQFVNLHLIPASMHIFEVLTSIRPGDEIVLKGYLVNIYVDGYPYIETSTVWTDSGPGSCEILYVTQITTGP